MAGAQGEGQVFRLLGQAGRPRDAHELLPVYHLQTGIINYHSAGKGMLCSGHKKHNCNTNEGCTYQRHNNQGLHFTEIDINSWDVFFKDRFMLAPQWLT